MVDDRLTLSFRQQVIRRFGAEHLMGYLVTCPWCVSPYIATVVAIPAVWWGLDFLPWHVRLVLSALLIPTASEVAGHLTKE